MTAMVPSAEIATGLLKSSPEAPLELVRVAAGVEDVAHDPSPEAWNT